MPLICWFSTQLEKSTMVQSTSGCCCIYIMPIVLIQRYSILECIIGLAPLKHSLVIYIWFMLGFRYNDGGLIRAALMVHKNSIPTKFVQLRFSGLCSILNAKMSARIRDVYHDNITPTTLVTNYPIRQIRYQPIQPPIYFPSPSSQHPVGKHHNSASG